MAIKSDSGVISAATAMFKKDDEGTDLVPPGKGKKPKAPPAKKPVPPKKQPKKKPTKKPGKGLY